MKKIGILGGSFDPVHYGHIGLAEDAREGVCLDKVYLIPAGMQPFKLDKKMADGRDRLEMIRLATESSPGLVPCDYELRNRQISYTYKTLEGISAIEGPDVEIYFITGTDTLLQIERWMNAEEMLRKYRFIVGSRPGYKDRELAKCIEHLKDEYNTYIVKIENRRRDISSTEIREKLENGQPLTGLVPEAVERYIRLHGLY